MLRLSVIIPAYNSASTMRRCLDALVASDLPRTQWELIVADDGSTDETSRAASSTADRVVTIPDGPRGPAFARNEAARHATGDVLVFVDADVCVSRTALRQFAEFFEAQPATGAVFGAYDTAPDATNVVSQYRNLLHHYVHSTNAGAANTFWAGCGAVRRDVFAALGGFDATRYPTPQIEDIELGYRMSAQGIPIRLAPDIQGQHLKRWTLLGGLVTDVRDRGIPWMRLLLERGEVETSADLNVRSREKLLTALGSMGVLFLAGGLLLPSVALLVAGVLAMLGVIAGNWPLLKWFAAERGVAFAIRIIPLRLAYYVLNGLAVASAVLLHLRDDLKQPGTRTMRSPLVQSACVVISLLGIAVYHHASDGLWFQGDAPRHALNGLFWWDLITATPAHPLDFTLRYYARYPAINPATYPPLFYLLEGAAFWLFGASAYVARGLVLLFALAACLYTMAWARRWIDPVAGWAGVFASFTPGIVLWSNTVMLNVPALALGMATLYHCRRWIETSRLRQLVLTMLFAALTLATYYPSACVLPVCCVWVVYRHREIRARKQLLWLAAAAVCTLLPVAATFIIAPVQAARHLPSLPYLLQLKTWTYYWRTLPFESGWVAIRMGVAGILVAAYSPRWRKEAVYLALWIVVALASVSVLPARDARYGLLATPALVVAATLGVYVIAKALPLTSALWQGALLVVALGIGAFSAVQETVPTTSGFRDIAVYLRDHAPGETVLFDGDHSGVFVFHVRAFDPDFHQRVVLGNKLLYQSAPRATFDDVRQTNVASVADVVSMVRTKCGCRWIAVERPAQQTEPAGRRMLLDALARADFQLVQSFAVRAAGPRRIDLYRTVGAVERVTAIDMQFPAYSNKDFPGVVPITR